MAKIRRVLIKTASLQYSDYVNVHGHLVDIDGEYATVSVPSHSFCLEDEKELKKDGDNYIVRVKVNQLKMS